MPTEDEYNRILKNPDNIIVSEELIDLLDIDVEEESSSDTLKTTLSAGDNLYVCSVFKATKSTSGVKFVLLVPTLSLNDFLLFDGPLVLMHEGNKFVQQVDTESELSEGILTITTRRIVK